jgi:urea transport system permease protein
MNLARKEVGYLVLLVLAACAPLYLSGYEVTILGRFLAFAILALGISLIWGTGGILSLGQGLFFGLGGYALAMYLKLVAAGPGQLPDFMEWNGVSTLPWWWAPFANPVFALAAVIIVPGAVAFALAFLVFRRRVSGPYFAIITQALVLAAATFVISQQPYTGGFNGLTNFTGGVFGFQLTDPNTQLALYFVTLALLAAAFYLLRYLKESRFGRLLMAIRDGENRVRFLGYDPVWFKVIAFTIAGALAGVSGALVTLSIGDISPAMFGVVPSIEMVIWVAVGGRDSLLGAIVGTLLVNFGKDWISSAFPSLWLFIVGALFIIVVTVAPRGLVPLAKVGTIRVASLLRRPRVEPAIE